jgi:DHA2 family multidrug resistance protein
MRNLGGAIGLALIDTVIYSRSTTHAVEITNRLVAGDIATARFVGIPLEFFAARVAAPLDAVSEAVLKPMIAKASLTLAINEAWAMIALLTAAVLICVPFTRSAPIQPVRHRTDRLQ